jgi:hypothetical protein
VQLVDTNWDGNIDIQCAGVTLLNDGAGNFTISGSSGWTGAIYAKGLIPSQSYMFLGVAYRYGSNTVLVNYQPPPPHSSNGDANMDGQVNLTDLLLLAACFGKRVGDAGFNPYCDFNGDGAIDVSDLLILAMYWGT